MIDPIIRTDADVSLGVAVYVCRTNPIFATARHLRTRSHLLNLVSNLPVKPPSSGHLLSQTVPCPSSCFASSKLRREPAIYMASRCICESRRRQPTRSTTREGRGQVRVPHHAPETFVQFPPPSLASLRLCRARQTRRIRRARKQSPAERVYHTRDERVLRPDVLRALRLCLLRLLRLRPLLLLRSRRLSSPRPGRRRTLRNTRTVVARASRDLRPVRIVARVIRVRLGATRCARGRGKPGLAGQLPHLHRGERAAAVAAVVARRPEAAPAPHALRLFYAVAWVVVMMMMTRCGRGDIVGG